jgi:hypothetical protein
MKPMNESINNNNSNDNNNKTKKLLKIKDCIHLGHGSGWIPISEQKLKYFFLNQLSTNVNVLNKLSTNGAVL